MKIQTTKGSKSSHARTKVLVENMPTGTAALKAPVVVSSAAAAVTCNALTVTINWATATAMWSR